VLKSLGVTALCAALLLASACKRPEPPPAAALTYNGESASVAGDEKISFAWTPASGADSYLLTFYLEVSGAKLIAKQIKTTATSWEGYLSSGAYLVSVTARGEGGSSPESNTVAIESSSDCAPGWDDIERFFSLSAEQSAIRMGAQGFATIAEEGEYTAYSLDSPQIALYYRDAGKAGADMVRVTDKGFLACGLALSEATADSLSSAIKARGLTGKAKLAEAAEGEEDRRVSSISYGYGDFTVTVSFDEKSGTATDALISRTQ